MKKIIIILIVYLTITVPSQIGNCQSLTFDAIQELVDSLNTHFPAICQRVDIGNSVLGEPISAMKISDNVTVDENEPEIMLEGCIHGDEQVAANLLCNLARKFCLQYITSQQVQDLVNSREIWILPVINPDGYIGEPGWGPTRVNANHVDLNRDAGYMWTGYYGSSPGPFSQPETKALRGFIISRNFNLLIDYHSGLQGIMYPWAYRPDDAPDNGELAFLANAYDASSGYPAGQFAVSKGYDLYQTNGSFIEFTYGTLGINSFTVELFTGFSGTGSLAMEYNQASIIMMIDKAGLGILGTVTDANTGNPIPARITIQGKMPVYNSSSIGDYHKFLLPGTYSVTVSANGYNSETVSNVIVTTGNATTIDFQLTAIISDHSAFRIITVKNFQDGVMPADPAETWKVPEMPDGLYYSLGDTGYIVLDPGASLVDVSGPDITVTGSGNIYDLFYSSTPDGPWTFLGNGTSTQSFELGNVQPSRYIKIADNGNGSGNAIGAGFHLDAVTVVQTTVGIVEPEAKSMTFQMYPNPTTGIVHISSSISSDGHLLITIFDVIGRQVYQTESQIVNGFAKIDLSYFPKGMYFVRIQNGTTAETVKVILQ